MVCKCCDAELPPVLGWFLVTTLHKLECEVLAALTIACRLHKLLLHDLLSMQTQIVDVLCNVRVLP